MVHNYFTSVNFNVSYNSIENHQINGRNIKIEVDGKIIQFSKRSKFKDKGMHILKYNINRHLSNMSLFYVNHSNIITIDMTNCNTENITNMAGIFCECECLKIIL